MTGGNRVGHVALALCLLGYIGYALPLLPLAADDLRMVSVFSIDESDIVAEIGILQKAGLMHAPSFKYGGVYYYVPAIPLKLWGYIGEVSERLMVLSVRLFGLVAGAGCLCLASMLQVRHSRRRCCLLLLRRCCLLPL